VAKIPHTILVAPDSFKGTLTASEVTQALCRGLSAAGFSVDRCPVADGGEGTMEVLASALGADVCSAGVSDPLGRPIEAPFALASVRGTVLGIVETAAASGLALVGERERDAVAATTYGTGELIMSAVDAGARAIYLGVGGSATTDGGAGVLEAVRDGGGLQGATLTVLCDVRTPFEQAAVAYGPQKGAAPDEVKRLTARLGRLARSMSRDPRGVPMTGAAGGLSGGLWAELGAELVPGASFVLDRLDFDRRMRLARAVVTGEGRIDQQSLAGKAVSEVATRTRQSGVPCHAVVGQAALDPFGLRILDLQAVLEAGTVSEIEAAGRRLAELVMGEGLAVLPGQR
jgi:glycerate kinase